ncbi:MAG: 50S ribosomal protein L18 [Candidatus Moranbacteria bacterium]|nr:50S ribosomal protein L18 [Candidatus Moranbacteria bacterium]
MKLSRNKLRMHRKLRIRAKISGTGKLPRLSVFRSLKGIYVQVIDDNKKTTIVSARLKDIKAKNNIAGANGLGKTIAKKCMDKKISAVVFDRSGYKYHGKIKALAEGAREGGLKF